MDMLKKEVFTHNTIKLELSELSALQRINYVEHLAKAERNLPALDDQLSEMEITRLLLRLDIETGAMLVGMSLWHLNRKGPTPEEIAADVAGGWPPEAIRGAELVIKRISNMLPPEPVPGSGDEENEATERSREDEPVTAEKPMPVS